MKTVKVDDQTHFLARFENGCSGTLEASWVAWGRKLHLAFELNGSTEVPDSEMNFVSGKATKLFQWISKNMRKLLASKPFMQKMQRNSAKPCKRQKQKKPQL